jgi:ketosteroid isomerase-like protein
MPDWLTEDAFMPMLTGVFVSIVLLLMAYSARNRTVLIVGLLVAALTAGIVITERTIVTEREKLVGLIHRLAKHAQRNDVEALVTQVSDDAPTLKKRLYAHMSEYKVVSCSIVGFNEVTITEPTASVELIAWAQGAQRRGDGLKGQINPKVTLGFLRDAEGVWKITDYTLSDPRSGFSL